MLLWRRRDRQVLAAGGVAVTACLVWAMIPLGPFPAVKTELHVPDSNAPEESDIEPLHRAAFSAKLWNPVPAPAVAEADPEPTEAILPPPNLQLIGIVRDTTENGAVLLRAALYDPATDKMHIVASGEQISGVLVAAIEPGTVHLDAGGRRTALVLRDEQSWGKQP